MLLHPSDFLNFTIRVINTYFKCSPRAVIRGTTPHTLLTVRRAEGWLQLHMMVAVLPASLDRRGSGAYGAACYQRRASESIRITQRVRGAAGGHRLYHTTASVARGGRARLHVGPGEIGALPRGAAKVRPALSVVHGPVSSVPNIQTYR